MALPDSPPAPEPVRAPRPARLPRWLLFIVGATALLLAGGWWNQRSLARIALPNGGTLRLVKAHYGPTYHDVRPIGLLERVKHWLPQPPNALYVPVGERDHGQPGDPPRLWLVFEADGVKRTDAGMLIVPRIETLQDGMLLDGVDAEFPPPDDLIGDGALRRPRIIVGLKFYPRRARQLELRLFLEQGTVEATIPNPLPLHDVPPWTPEPLPQTRTLKSREVVLHSVRRDRVVGRPSDVYIRWEREVRESGIPPDAFNVQGIFSDGTGNESSKYLPAGEPVWRLHALVWRTEQYPFTAAEIVAPWRTTIPGPGEFRIFQLPGDPALGNRRYLVLAGVGEYRTRYDQTLTFETAPAVTASPPQTPARVTSSLKCAFPQLLVFHQGLPPGESSLFLRSVFDGKVHKLFTLDYTSGQDRERRGYGIGFQGKDTPPAGTEVEFQFINEQADTVDFYIRPPE